MKYILFVLCLFCVPLIAEEKLFIEEEISFVSDGHLIKGTLSVPPNQNGYAIVLIAGSGRQSRNEEVAGFKVFKTLSEKLVDKSFTTLRYDKRGCFQSEGDYPSATTQDFTKDAAAAIDYLASRQDLALKAIGGLGHSEGSACLASLAANKSRLAFAISMGGPATSGYDTLLNQVEWGCRFHGGLSEEETQKKLDEQRAVMDAALAGDHKTLRSLLESIIREQIKALPGSTQVNDDYIETATQQMFQTMSSPWMQYFLSLNPADDWAKTKVPVLALFGEKDTQVSPKLNLEPMKKALTNSGRDDFSVIVIPEANHLFQTAKTGDVSEYGILEKNFTPHLLDIIVGWFKP